MYITLIHEYLHCLFSNGNRALSHAVGRARSAPYITCGYGGFRFKGRGARRVGEAPWPMTGAVTGTARVIAHYMSQGFVAYLGRFPAVPGPDLACPVVHLPACPACPACPALPGVAALGECPAPKRETRPSVEVCPWEIYLFVGFVPGILVGTFAGVIVKFGIRVVRRFVRDLDGDSEGHGVGVRALPRGGPAASPVGGRQAGAIGF